MGNLGENLGLFTSYYPLLDDIPNDDEQLPDAVKEFNRSLDNPKLWIHSSDWKALLKIYMDHSVRSNESFFLKDTDNEVDIWSCQRFETVKAIRRPARKPKEKGRSTVKLLLAALHTGKSNPTDGEISTSFNENLTLINKVSDALWKVLKEKLCLIQKSQRWDEENERWKDERSHILKKYRAIKKFVNDNVDIKNIVIGLSYNHNAIEVTYPTEHSSRLDLESYYMPVKDRQPFHDMFCGLGWQDRETIMDAIQYFKYRGKVIWETNKGE